MQAGQSSTLSFRVERLHAEHQPRSRSSDRHIRQRYAGRNHHLYVDRDQRKWFRYRDYDHHRSSSFHGERDDFSGHSLSGHRRLAQFTATVTGATNTSVIWSATGGTISSSGLYTAGAAAGSFTVKATSVQDSTKSASANVTITMPQPVSVSISPNGATLFTGGTQTFTATVANATNPAVTWSATGGVITTSGQYTAGQTPGTYSVTATSVQDLSKSASVTVTITQQTASGAHPRIILDTPTLATLRSRAQANTAEWSRLKSTCDSYVGGGVEFINGIDYPDRPNVGEGYQGSGYIEALMPLGLCYHSILPSDPTRAAQYVAKAVAILMAMSDPAHQTASDCNCAPCRCATTATGCGILVLPWELATTGFTIK